MLIKARAIRGLMPLAELGDDPNQVWIIQLYCALSSMIIIYRNRIILWKKNQYAVIRLRL